MVAEKEFKDYTATYEDADGDKHKSTVRAHVVTEATAGTVVTRTGTQDVDKGSVIVETDRPGVYDVLSADDWKGTGYGSASNSSARKSTAGKK